MSKLPGGISVDAGCLTPPNLDEVPHQQFQASKTHALSFTPPRLHFQKAGSYSPRTKNRGLSSFTVFYLLGWQPPRSISGNVLDALTSAAIWLGGNPDGWEASVEASVFPFSES